MEAIINEQADSEAPTVQLPTLSYEWLAYGIVIVLALVLRLAELDAIPLNDAEAQRAFAAWQVVQPTAAGTAITPSSPITFWLQVTSYTLLGSNEFTARLPGLIGGLLLMLTPLLFRERIGRARAFLAVLLLAFTPLTILTARSADPLLWGAVGGLVVLWAVLRYYETRQLREMLYLAAATAALVFLITPTGILLVGILVGAALGAFWWQAWSQPQEMTLEQGEPDAFAAARQFWQELRWQPILLVMIAVTVLSATSFLMYPTGLAQVGEVLGGFLRGFWQPAQPNAPLMFPVLTLLIYDPLLLIFAGLAVLVLLNQERLGVLERFFVLWFVIGAVVFTLYRGGDAGHALWLALPLLALSVSLLAELIQNRRVLMLFFDEVVDDDLATSAQRFWSVKWFIGLIMLALLGMLAVHTQEVGRGLLLMPVSQSLGDNLALVLEPSFAMFRYSLIWCVISALFLVIGFFIGASIWGNINTLQGFGLGIFFFMLASGIGGGWNATVVHVNEAGEFWQTAAVSKDVLLLRQTLNDLAMRETKGFPKITITVVLDETQGITDSGLVAWLLRDYPNVHFVTSLEDARQAEIVLLAAQEAEPELGGTYVGQSFLLRSRWSLGSLTLGDVPLWWTTRQLRVSDIPQETVVLWLRSDIYNFTLSQNQNNPQ